MHKALFITRPGLPEVTFLCKLTPKEEPYLYPNLMGVSFHTMECQEDDSDLNYRAYRDKYGNVWEYKADFDFKQRVELKWPTPESLTVESIKAGTYSKLDYEYKELHEFLLEVGYGDLGWRNDASAAINKADFKDMTFNPVYTNNSGTQCLFVNHTKRLIYSVDMGD